jgi:hypothetical protein
MVCWVIAALELKLAYQRTASKMVASSDWERPGSRRKVYSYDQVFLIVSPDGNAAGVSSKMEVSSKMDNITVFLHDHGEWKQIDSLRWKTLMFRTLKGLSMSSHIIGRL